MEAGESGLWKLTHVIPWKSEGIERISCEDVGDATPLLRRLPLSSDMTSLPAEKTKVIPRNSSCAVRNDPTLSKLIEVSAKA